MTVELVTGYAGAAHITASDDGWFNAGVVGSDCYVLDTGAQLACSVSSNTAVQIGTGDAVMQGRHIRVHSQETVTIDNGAQGVNRNDIVCLKYERNTSTGIESASIAVVKGTATSGTPSDPAIPSGNILENAAIAYMPLWRLPITGINIGTPEIMYGDILSPLADVSGSIDASRITGTLATSNIPNLSASKITSGTLGASRIPSLNASKINDGQFALARMPFYTLYSDSTGTVDTVTLSDSAANYSFIEIFYKSTNDNIYGSVKVDNPNGKRAQFNAAMITSSADFYIKTKTVYINGTSITQSGYAGFIVANTGEYTPENGFAIYKVIGWK